MSESRKAIADSLPGPVQRISQAYGTDAVLDAAEFLFGYPASWIDTHDEQTQLLNYLEK